MEIPKKPHIILKEYRKKSGISLEEMTLRTRFDPKYFVQFEVGNTDFFPAIYFKLFLKAYAKAIGFPQEEALRLFFDWQNNSTPDDSNNESQLLFSTVQEEIKRRKIPVHYWIGIAIFSVVILVFVLSGLFARNGENADVKNRKENTPLEIPNGVSGSRDSVVQFTLRVISSKDVELDLQIDQNLPQKIQTIADSVVSVKFLEKVEFRNFQSEIISLRFGEEEINPNCDQPCNFTISPDGSVELLQ